VSGLTSSRDFAGSVSRHVAVAAWPCCGLYRPWCVSDLDFPGFSHFRGSWGSYLAQTGPVEGDYSCVASPAW
jgi:hypothetical protein